MPLNQIILHVIDSRELEAHLFYEGCNCNPYFLFDVKNGESIKVVNHVSYNNYHEPKYETYDSEGKLIKHKQECY